MSDITRGYSKSNEPRTSRTPRFVQSAEGKTNLQLNPEKLGRSWEFTVASLLWEGNQNPVKHWFHVNFSFNPAIDDHDHV